VPGNLPVSKLPVSTQLSGSLPGTHNATINALHFAIQVNGQNYIINF